MCRFPVFFMGVLAGLEVPEQSRYLFYFSNICTLTLFDTLSKYPRSFPPYLPLFPLFSDLDIFNNNNGENIDQETINWRQRVDISSFALFASTLAAIIYQEGKGGMFAYYMQIGGVFTMLTIIVGLNRYCYFNLQFVQKLVLHLFYCLQSTP